MNKKKRWTRTQERLWQEIKRAEIMAWCNPGLIPPTPGELEWVSRMRPMRIESQYGYNRKGRKARKLWEKGKLNWL